MTLNNFVVGAGLGAGLLFLLDPQSGRRRRARARDKVVHWSRKGRAAADVVAKDLANRTRGVVSATRRRLQSREVDDVRLRERVRAALGRVTSHPRAIDVEVDAGDVIVRGPILAAEMDGVMRAVNAVPGVRTVINMLEHHESADNVPALHGGAREVSGNWAPSTQALVTITGVVATGLWLATYARKG